MSESTANKTKHIFIIGAKSIGLYGGYETFVEHLIDEHKDANNIKYHVACKHNGDGAMDESKLEGEVTVLKTNKAGEAIEYEYKNTHVFEIKCPDIGPAVALYYDRAALLFSIRYCKEHDIKDPIFYVLTCRIGLYIDGLVRKIRKLGGKYFLNPDGHEWKRAKWSRPVRAYWKWSEKKMVNKADLVICDSVNIEKYIHEEYGVKNTTYIAYGADIKKSELKDDDPKFTSWLDEHGLTKYGYYMCCGRFVPENSFEIMIREFMLSDSKRDFAIITTKNDSLLEELEQKLHWRSDKRIKFVGTVYDSELLKKIRENAYGNFHGHTVGGTNPSLLEALGSTELNLLINVGFNREVAKEAALYWSGEKGDLAKLIDSSDLMSPEEREAYGIKAKQRIRDAFSWKFIGDEYMKVWS